MVKKPAKEKSPENGEVEEEHRESGSYQCVGDFKADFQALCQEAKLLYIPPVIPRKQSQNQLNLNPVPEERIKSTKNKRDLRSSSSSRLGCGAKTTEQETSPESCTSKTPLSFHMPSVRVESPDPEKMDQVSEIYIRNWLVSSDMMTILHQCCGVQTRLTLLSLWRVGLNPTTFEQLCCLVQGLSSLRTLLLDNNLMEPQEWHALLRGNSPIQHLSLRYNRITAKGCRGLASALSALCSQPNSRLLSLNLSGNWMGDEGAELLADGLKFNSCLLYLDLSNNCIGNYGARKLAQAISKFPLSNEEVVLRRRCIWDLLKPTSEEMKGDPAMEEADQPLGRKPLKVVSTADVKAPREGDKKKLKKKENTEKTDGKKVVDFPQETEEEPTSDGQNHNPVLKPTEFDEQDGRVYMRGNFNLVSLNLSHNCIGDTGCCHLLNAIKFQEGTAEGSWGRTARGLMRLALKGNVVDPCSEVVGQIELAMKDKNPMSAINVEARV